MRIIEKEAKTEEDAINLVLKELGTDDKSVIKNIEVTDNKIKFLNFSNKKLKVKVTVYDNREQEIFTNVKELLSQMDIKVNNIKVLEYDESKTVLTLSTDKDSLLIGKRGKTLEAAQYIINIICNKNHENRIKIILDVEDYRAKRVQSLQKLAKNLALKVRKTRKDKILEQMNPYERKIIHAALQDERDIGTDSLGDGVFKRIKISLKR